MLEYLIPEDIKEHSDEILNSPHSELDPMLRDRLILWTKMIISGACIGSFVIGWCLRGLLV